MFSHIVAAKYLEAYKLRLTFNNGTVKDVNLESELYGEVFEPLQDKTLFKQVCINPDTNTIEWPNGVGFAPEYLDEIGTVVTTDAQGLALQVG